MTDDKTKFRIKLGAAEIEYEGSADALKEVVMPAVSRMLELVQDHADLQRPITTIQSDVAAPVALPVAHQPKASALTTNTIATKLGASTATDLAIAASARLILFDGRETFTRDELLKEMKAAPTFYKATMSNNLSSTLKTLTKADRLRLVAADTFSLSSQEKQQLESKLAEA